MEFIGYPVFKGLQKPLEFMGIRGRFLLMAAITVATSLIGGLILMSVVGKAIGFIWLLGTLAVGLISIYVKQKKGLHSKKRYNGFVIYRNIFKQD